MAKSVQYSNNSGTSFTALGVSVADYTLSGGGIADGFYSVKDSNDNLYILCTLQGNWDRYARIIKIDKTGVITNPIQNTTLINDQNSRIELKLSRDEKTIFFLARAENLNGNLYSVDVDNLDTFNIYMLNVYGVGVSYIRGFAIYKDQYIWVANGEVIKIYDYDTKVELASTDMDWFTEGAGGSGDKINCFCLGLNGESVYLVMWLYDGIIDAYTTVIGGLNKMYGGDWSKLFETVLPADISPKQILLDKYGDLIILTNSGTASTLLKYTTAGVQIGTTLDLGGVFYNLNTDYEGNYYYSNVTGYWKIPKNIAQGQMFNTPEKIRDTGSVTYGNNDTGYSPAVQA